MKPYDKEALHAAKDQFRAFYEDHLLKPGTGKTSGLWGLGIGIRDTRHPDEIGLVVYATSKEWLDDVPDSFEGFPVYKHVAALPRPF